MAGKKSSAKEIAAMKYTQPKMIKVYTNGKAKMVVAEPSQRDQDAAKAAAEAAQKAVADELTQMTQESGLE